MRATALRSLSVCQDGRLFIDRLERPEHLLTDDAMEKHMKTRM